MKKRRKRRILAGATYWRTQSVRTDANAYRRTSTDARGCVQCQLQLQLQLQLILLFRLPPERRKQDNLSDMIHFPIALRAGSRTKSKSACQTAHRTQRLPCKTGRRTSISVIGWTSTTGRISTQFCNFHSLIRFGRLTSCQGASSGSNTPNFWRKWEVAVHDAGYLGP